VFSPNSSKFCSISGEDLAILSANTIASQSKILQNTTKPAVEKVDWPEDLAAKRPPILGKSGRKPTEKIYILKIMCFPQDFFVFLQFYSIILLSLTSRGSECLCSLNHLWLKYLFLKCRIFSQFGRNFRKFADNPFWDLATVPANRFSSITLPAGCHIC
jgi:hypothetical protein